MARLPDKVAVVTGGNSGIGFATAQEFIAQGAHVVLTGRNAPAVQDAAAALGPRAVGVVSDAAQMADLRRLAAQVQAHHAHVDVLFVNAGVSYSAPIAQVDEAHFDTQFTVNVKGSYFTIQQLLPLINDGGSIILNASATVHQAFPDISVYVATKAAVASLARTLSVELLGRHIRVNAISPGPITTPFYDKMIPAAFREQATAGFTQLVPMKRFGRPEEIATIATFLASDESSFVVGAEIIAGGGIGTL